MIQVAIENLQIKVLMANWSFQHVVLTDMSIFWHLHQLLRTKQAGAGKVLYFRNALLKSVPELGDLLHPRMAHSTLCIQEQKVYQNAQNEQVVIKHLQNKSRQQSGQFGTLPFRLRQLLSANTAVGKSPNSGMDYTCSWNWFVNFKIFFA